MITLADLTPAEAVEYKRRLKEARKQGFCPGCAKRTALGMVVGLHYLGDLASECKDCWRRLNPRLESYWHHNERKYRVKVGWTRKAAKMTTKRCQQCHHEFAPRRSTALFCSDRCRLIAKRGSDRRQVASTTPL